jgi:amidase
MNVFAPLRQMFVAVALIHVAGATAQSTATNEFSIKELAAQMDRGETTSHAIVQRYLDRITAIDKSGPTINAIIELNPDALNIADQLDAERKNGKVRGPLHGIPVVIKDNIDTADNMHSSAGSLALANSIAPKDSDVAAQLRAAGAVIIGKTNLSEWANARSTRSSSGWSGRGGQTKNPYALDRNPCGSSSGTGAGVAANLATVGVGTETDGSIVCPSAANGLVGIKPTVGLIGGAGIVPIARSQDTAGPMARSVEDAAILLTALVTNASHRADYASALDANGLKGVRIGVVRKLADTNPDVKALFEKNIVALRAAGAVIVDPAELPNIGKYDDAENIVLQFEFKHDINAYLAALPTSANAPRSLADLIAFNEHERVREMPWFGQEQFEQAQARGDLSEKIYVDALKKSKLLAGKNGIDAALARYRVDALIAPTGGPAWTTDWVNGDHFDSSSSSPAAVAGYPDITVPMGFVHGLPVGISFFGAAWSEAKLIKIAYAFEQATRARKPPTFIAHVE